MTARIDPLKPKSRAITRATSPVKAKALAGNISAQPVSKRRPRGNVVGNSMFQFAANLSPLQAHDLVTKGLPVVAARELMASFHIIDRNAVLRAVGISERTLQRGKAAGKLLDANASDRAMRLASVAEQAIDVLGSQAAAERWLSTPAMGLDQRIPIDLLQSSEGTDLVRTLLTRMDHGVYA